MHLIAISLCFIHRGRPYQSLNAENIRNKNSYIRWTLELLVFVILCDKTIMKFVKMADPDVPWVPPFWRSTWIIHTLIFIFQPGSFALIKAECNPNCNIVAVQLSAVNSLATFPPLPPSPHSVLNCSHCSCVSPFSCMGRQEVISMYVTHTQVCSVLHSSDCLKASRTFFLKFMCVHS